ncbi:hypothetical protein L798_09521 [Zootermopsis nevadensis]|uniref:Uncharacterized protein n=1 Tax=Zootermopsis nevadensis TaxID=136037 RepID=A0A067RDC8_ZOONE|nr:hypothetical protein L798_09521 [Zootermopsis nevadensis]
MKNLLVSEEDRHLTTSSIQLKLKIYISWKGTLHGTGDCKCASRTTFIFHPELTKVLKKVATWYIFHKHAVWLLECAASQHGDHVGMAAYPLHHCYL